ncbi:MAG: hypothetical protein WC130_04970 [Kiritimatiellia bacterium]
MAWYKWKRWRFAYSTWAGGVVPNFRTDASGKWIPLVAGVWFLLYPTPTKMILELPSTFGFYVGDTPEFPGIGRRLITHVTPSRLTLRHDTKWWRWVAWARSRPWAWS